MTTGMDRDPGDFPARTPPRPVAEMSAGEFDAWMATLPPVPGLPSTSQEIAASEALAMADFAAGRFYDHAVVSRWLRTWGSVDRKPFKDWLADQDG